MAESLTAQFSRLNVLGHDSGNPDQTRNWIPSQYPRICNGHPDGQTFTVASYNVLSQDLLVRHLELYSDCNQNHLKWDFRSKRLIQEIDKYQPDVLCLQEVNKLNFKKLLYSSLSKKGYHGIFKARPGANNEDGCLTFFKTDVFKLMKSKMIEYNLYDANCPGKSNVALLVALKFNSKEENNILCIANTHLLYNPCRGDIKTTQLMILLAEMEKLTAEYEHRVRTEEGDEFHSCPSILCGDLNLVPGSQLYEFLCGRRLDWSERKISDLSGLPLPNYRPRGFYDTCLKNCTFVPHQITRSCRFKDGFFDPELRKRRNGIFHRLNFVSSYPHHLRPFITSSHQGAKLNVDYILYSCAKTQVSEDGRFHSFPIREKGLHLLDFLDLPNASEDVGRMPNESNGSDHFLIMSRFVFF